MTVDEFESLATKKFEAQEYINQLRMCNEPTDYEGRKEAAIKYAWAQRAAFEAGRKLQNAIEGKLS